MECLVSLLGRQCSDVKQCITLFHFIRGCGWSKTTTVASSFQLRIFSLPRNGLLKFKPSFSPKAKIPQGKLACGCVFLSHNKKVHAYSYALGCNCIIGKYVVFWGEFSSPALTLHTDPARARQFLLC